MTPKEKAERLMKIFEMDDSWGELADGQKVDYALILVKEVLNEIPMTIDRVPNSRYQFWDSVKEQLESF